jgi:tetratricopeptide (TPR) repeat protein
MTRLAWGLTVAAFCVVGASELAAQRLKLPKSLGELEAAAQRDSTDPAAHYNVALGYWSAKRYDEAEKALGRSLSMDPRLAPAHLALAYLPYARRSKLWGEVVREEIPKDQVAVVEKSDREYRHAFLIDPLVDLRILGAVGPNSPDFIDVRDYWGEVWALFFQGFADCEEGKYEDCHGRFVTLIREIDGDRYPQRIPGSVLWYKGIAAAHINKPEIAADHFRELIKRSIEREKERESKGELARVPMWTNEYRYTLATILHSSGKTAEAIPLFEEVLNNDIGFYMAHVRLANIYEAQKDYARAAKSRQSAVDANPDDPSLLTDLGVTLGKAGDFAGAETRLQQAYDANPQDVRPLFWLGIARAQQGKSSAAREAFEQFVRLAPSRYDRQIAMAKDRLAQLQ